VLEVVTVVFWVLLAILRRVDKLAHRIQVQICQVLQVNVSVCQQLYVTYALLKLVRNPRLLTTAIRNFLIWAGRLLFESKLRLFQFFNVLRLANLFLSFLPILAHSCLILF